MKIRVAALALSMALSAVHVAEAGEFDLYEGDVLVRVAQADGVARQASLSLQALDALPTVLSDTRAAFFVVKTGQGNYARVLATPALRKPAEEGGPPISVLVLDRFDTFEPGKSGSRLARGAALILFDGMPIDLDSGQVVPAGQGGDLEFRKRGDGGPVLKALGKSVILTLSRPLAKAPAATGPSAGKEVLPGDFGGRYRLFADGRWSGLLELHVAPDRQLTGRFRSEANGTSYAVAGQVSAESPQQATFTVKFPNTEQEYHAYLWTGGKNVLAGSFTMTDRTYGFFAPREGARIEGLLNHPVSPPPKDARD